MNNMVQFSIVTPSFNYGHFIGECASSVAAQSDVSLEHFVFDGGSTDKTLEVLSGFPHLKVVSEPDRGMSDAINKGFDRCQGEWVMWLNADDRLHPGALAAVAEFAASHPEADVIYGCWNFVNRDGDYIRTMTLFPYQKAMMLYLGCYIGSTATFFRRRTVIDPGERLNLDFRYVMDGEIYARLASKGRKFVYLPQVLADFRLHGDNLSMRNHGGRSIDRCLTLQKQYAETRAIRRAYGLPPLANENLNTLIDSLLFLVFRFLKPVLKLIHRPRLRRDMPHR